MPETSEPVRKRRPRILLMLGFGLLAFLVSSSLVLGGVAYAYKGKFYPGTSVAGLNLSGKTKEEGAKAVSTRVKGYLEHPVKVVIPDLTKPADDATGKYPTLEVGATAGELGLSFADSAAVDAAWSVGHSRSLVSWFKTAIPSFFSGHQSALAYSIDKTKVDEFIKVKIVPTAVVPTPAKVAVQGTEVSVVPPKPGLNIDQDLLARQLATSLETATDTDTTFLNVPAKQMDSNVTLAAVQPVADRLKDISNLKIKLTAQGVQAAPTKANLLALFAPVQDDKGRIAVGLQKEALAQYLQGIKNLDQAKSLDAAVKALAPLATSDIAKAAPGGAVNVQVVAKPAAVVTPGTYTLGKFEGKYIEANLSEQKLYLINGNTLEKVYAISSGKWSTPTPLGTFTINGKATRAYSAAYGLYMPYWMNFKDNEYGIHELPEWPNGYKEGEAHLGTPVSHGCIRLGVGAAKEVYDWTPNGTQLYIH